MPRVYHDPGDGDRLPSDGPYPCLQPVTLKKTKDKKNILVYLLA